MKRNLLSGLLSLCAGSLYALAYPSFLGGGWFPLIFLALPLFLYLLENASVKTSLLIILCFNLGLNITGYYWIPHTLREFGQLPYIVSVILGMGFALILQPHWWVYAIWRKYRPRWPWTSERNVILSALIMTLLERFIPQQFPSYVGSPWLHMAPYLGLAPYFGVAIFSFITYWVCLEAVVQLVEKKLRLQVWVVLAAFVILNAVFPITLKEGGQELPVRIVQANIGNFMKVASETGDLDALGTVDNIYKKLSSKDTGVRPHLIIWPETAYPETFYGQATELKPLFTELMQEMGSEILIGGYDLDPANAPRDQFESVYNSSLLMRDGKVESIYHKNILIPFGETLPFGPLNRQIVSIVPAISLFARGQGIPVMETRAGFRFVTPICYEILESNYMRSLLNQWGGNHFIVNHTNDSWYGDTAEPHQHLFLSKWRALEFQLPIIRSTNTGISSVIFPDGSESARLGVGDVNTLDVKVPINKPLATVYQDWGALPLLILVGLIYLLTWWKARQG